MSPDIALSCSIIPGQLLSLTYSLGCPGFNHLSPADQPTIKLILVLRGETTGNNQQSLNLGQSYFDFLLWREVLLQLCYRHLTLYCNEERCIIVVPFDAHNLALTDQVNWTHSLFSVKAYDEGDGCM